MNKVFQRSKQIANAISKDNSFGYKNVMNAPRMKKIVITMGNSEAVADSKYMSEMWNILYEISGQYPCISRAKKSIAGFKTRKGMPLKVMVTLRKDQMFDFVDFLVNVVLPRERNFRGFHLKQVQNGAFSFGFSEMGVFPQAQMTNIGKSWGMNIVVVTSAIKDDALRFLKTMGFPFQQ